MPADSVAHRNCPVARESLKLARIFANALYGETLELRMKDLQSELLTQRNQCAAKGTLRSGDMLYATAQLYAQHIDHMVQTMADSLIEGYEVHGIQLDEQLAKNTIDEAMRVKDALLADCMKGDINRGGIFTAQQFAEEVSNASKVSRPTIAFLVDRRRILRS